MAEPLCKKPRRGSIITSEIPEYVYISEDDSEYLDSTSSNSCSSYISLDEYGSDVGDSSDTSVSLMDDGTPCDIVTKNGTKWWNEPTTPIPNLNTNYHLDLQPQLKGPSLLCESYEGIFYM